MSAIPVPPAAFDGFELRVDVDAPVYAPGQVVRITVTAVHDAAVPAVHEYPGWQRVVVTIRDEAHRAVATDEVHGAPPAAPPRAPGAADRWLPGTALVLPTWWDQRQGSLRPAWAGADTGPGERLEPGRYRARATWLGREPGRAGAAPEAWSSWFELV